jgi:hypothetical protein
MWFLGLGGEVELPTEEEDEAARAEMVREELMPCSKFWTASEALLLVLRRVFLLLLTVCAVQEAEESLMGEMNQQMVEAKLQLEAERCVCLMFCGIQPSVKGWDLIYVFRL